MLVPRIEKKIILLKRVKKMSYRISLIKIDVNGHEYSVVRGLQTIIKRDKPAMIIETMNYEGVIP